MILQPKKAEQQKGFCEKAGKKALFIKP